MDRSKFFAASSLIAVLSIPTIADAALVGRLAATEGGTDYQAYYDTEAGISWSANANLLYSGTAYGWGQRRVNADGSANWSTVNSRVGTPWRLPSSGSEMSNLLYNVLGNEVGQQILNTGPFSNIMSGDYWTLQYINSGSSISAEGVFNTVTGSTGIESTTQSNFAWAVADGDIFASAVPIPAAAWLFGSGLIGLIGFARKRK